MQLSTVKYTVWSRGRLIGETDLGFVYREGGFRCGWFHPNALGERLMPAATGVSPAMRTEFLLGPDPTFYADLMAAIDAAEALELELRDPTGKPIETEDIHIVDTHYLLELSEEKLKDGEEPYELTPEQEAEIEEMVAEFVAEHPAWLENAEPQKEIEFPRYQVQVQLVDHNDIP